MTLRGRLISLFPAFVVALLAGCIAIARIHPWIALGGGLFVLYLFPVLAFRVHDWLAPVREGDLPLGTVAYSPWYGAHQFQIIYMVVPALEATLRIFPGVYSAWLRLWGSRIGRGVYWTPGAEVADRNLVQIGNDVVVGHHCRMSGHVISPSSRGLRVIVQRVTVGDHAFLGAASFLAPGVVVEPGALVRFDQRCMPFERVAAKLPKSASPLAPASLANGQTAPHRAPPLPS